MDILSIYGAAAGYTLLIIAVAAALIAGVILVIVGGAELLHRGDTSAGVVLLVLGILGLFVPFSAAAGLVIAGVYAFRSGAKGFGITAIVLLCVRILLVVILIVTITLASAPYIESIPGDTYTAMRFV